MTELNELTRIRKIMALPELKNVGRFFLYGSISMKWLCLTKRIGYLKNLNWNTASVLYGIRRLREVGKQGNCIHLLYSKNQYHNDPQKADVNVIHFPAAGRNSKKPFIIIAAGGAYHNVCSLGEGYPVAARFNELGYDAFVLTYRVGGTGVLPKPLEDLSAAVHYVRKHADRLGVNPDRYIVCGFSAGANLTALWGTENHGYRNYKCPKPVAMFPIYPVISTYSCGDEKHCDFFLNTMLGKSWTEEMRHAYNVDEHMDAEYPPCYIVCCEDDDTVDAVNSYRFKDKLDALGVPAELEIGRTGGHGFGEGIGTDVEGWIARASAFVDKILP